MATKKLSKTKQKIFDEIEKIKKEYFIILKYEDIPKTIAVSRKLDKMENEIRELQSELIK
jgi:hypothetical protein